MVKSAIQVFLRTKPSEAASREIAIDQDKKTVQLTLGSRGGLPTSVGSQSHQYAFKYDGVLHNATQEDVFEACGREVLEKALQGYNGTIMCYGQTGAGKTYTMTGGKQHYKQRGLVPRILTHLFAELRSRPQQRCRVSISYLEIYNEALYDLLDITTQPHELSIHEDRRGRVAVHGLCSCGVDTEADALRSLFEGETNRVIGEHQLNRESSRSHSIFTITLEMRDVAVAAAAGGEEGAVVVSKVNLVDLAGSERVSKTRSEGHTLKEAGHINKSLHILEQVILAASEKNRDHVPYRSSKLTHVLKDSLGGNCATILVGNIWAESAQLEETLSTCRFAQRMSRITCEVSVNVLEDSSARVRQLQRQVSELQQELALHDMMAGRTGVEYTPYSEPRRAELRSLVARYLSGSRDSDSLEPLQIVSLRHVREIMYACKCLFHDRPQGPPEDPPAAAPHLGNGAAAAHGQAAVSSTSTTAPLHDKDWHEYVGDDGGEHVQSGGVGVAPEGARPDAPGEQGVDGDDAATAAGPGPGSHTGAAAACTTPQNGRHHDATAAATPDRKAALEAYRKGPGEAKSQLLADNSIKLKKVKQRSKELALEINTIKHDIDAVKARADELKAARLAAAPTPDADGQLLGTEEYEAVTRLKELKSKYRDQYSELQMLRSEVEYTQCLVETCKQELLTEFDQWYSSTYHTSVSEGDDMQLLEQRPGSGERVSPREAPHEQASSATTSPATKTKSNRRQATAAAVTNPEDGDVCDAAAYYEAQQVLYGKSSASATKQATLRNKVTSHQKGTFSTTSRSQVTDKPANA